MLVDWLNRWRGDYDPPKLYRCLTCGKLLTDAMTDTGECVGHRTQYAMNGTIWEWIKIKLRLLA